MPALARRSIAVRRPVLALLATILASTLVAEWAAAGQREQIPAQISEAASLLNRQSAPGALKILEPLLENPAVTEDHVLLAEVLFHAGWAYFQLNDYPKALPYYERVLTLSRALHDRAGEARSLLGIAQVYKNQGAYQRALEHGEGALSLFQALRDRQAAARTWTLLGSVQDLTGRHRQALESYRNALGTYDDPKQQAALRLLNEIGITLKNLGNYQEALDDYARALEGQREIGDRYGQAVTLSNTGVAYRLLGQDDLAIESYKNSLAIAREINERRGESILLGNLGEIYLDHGDAVRAREYFEQQLQLTRTLGNRNEEASALMNLGDVDASHGKLEQARGNYERALEIRRQIGARHRESATLVAMAALDLKKGEALDGAGVARQALALARDAEAPDLEWRARLILARAVRASGQTSEALDELRASVRVVNDLRANVWTDVGKIGFVDSRQEVFEELADVLMSAGRSHEALEAAEAGRARAFADLLEQRHVRAKPAEQDTLAAVRAALDETRAAPAQMAAAATVSGARDAQIRSAPAGADDTLDGSLARLRAEHRELASLLTAESPDAAEIAATARRLQVTFVEYFVTDKQLLAWVVSPDGNIHGTTIEAGRARIEMLVRDLRTAIENVDLEALRHPARLTPGLRELDRLLIAPLAGWLPASPDALVVLIPHGPLAVLPFAALEDAAGKPLIARHTLAFAPAVSVYRYTADKRRSRPTDAGQALILADPTPPPSSQVASLPGAREEGRQVARQLRQPGVRLLTGSQASEAAFKREAGAQRILHIATHGLISSERPLASSLVLAAGEGEDGYLRMDEILGLPLAADLVVLSGCSTGLGRLSGDGIVGLSRAFIYAGTPAVVVSQWDISDRSTTYMMNRFYAAVRQGRETSAALRAAQLATRRLFPHPALWAAFTLVGEPR